MQDSFPDAPYHQYPGTVTSAAAGSAHTWTFSKYSLPSCVFYFIAYVERAFILYNFKVPVKCQLNY